jgi:hypothetical protein
VTPPSKRELKPGDKIKFVGPLGGTTGFFEYGTDPAIIAEVTYVDAFDCRKTLDIKFEYGGIQYKGRIHRRQVVSRLRRKEKPKEEREKWWLLINKAGSAVALGHPPAVMSNQDRLVAVQEIPPGSVVVSREKLAKAYEKHVLTLGLRAEGSGYFRAFADALGLPKGEA